MKAIFMSALLLVTGFVQAVEKPAQVPEEVRVWTSADAIPVGKGVTLSDSKGCVWFVAEVDQVLKVMRPQNPDGTPICVKSPQAK